MTKARRRHLISGFADEYADMALMLHGAYKTIRKNRSSTMPREVSASSRQNAVYNFNDVLMFQIAMTIRGHSLKQASEVIDIPLHTLRRVVRKYDYGQVKDELRMPSKDKAYVIHRMLEYIDEAESILQYQLPDHQRMLLNKKRGLD